MASRFGGRRGRFNPNPIIDCAKVPAPDEASGIVFTHSILGRDPAASMDGTGLSFSGTLVASRPRPTRHRAHRSRRLEALDSLPQDRGFGGFLFGFRDTLSAANGKAIASGSYRSCLFRAQDRGQARVEVCGGASTGRLPAEFAINRFLTGDTHTCMHFATPRDRHS